MDVTARSKFKVGDAVVEDKSANCPNDLVEHWNEYWGERIGAYAGRFYVTGTGPHYICYSAVPGGAGPQVSPNYLKAAPKFAVGDRVRVVNYPADYWHGDGKIADVVGDIVIVAFDDGKRRGGFQTKYVEPAATPEAATLTIQAGRYYKTRDGRKVGPMERNSGCDDWPWAADNYGDYCRDDGTTHYGNDEERDNDLIAEWPATEDSYTSCAAAEVDNLRDEYGPYGEANDNDEPKFKVGDYITKSARGWKTEGYKVTKIAGGKVYLDSGTNTGYIADYDIDDYWIVVTSAPEPDSRLLVTLTADTSELDAEIDRVKRRLKKLAKRARKLGIRLDYDLAA